MQENCITIYTEENGEPIGDLFGIFIEDLNHAADGGLYPEMVQNRSFEFQKIDNPSYHSLTAWEIIGTTDTVAATVKEGNAVSPGNPHYLQLDRKTETGDAGIRNLGFGKGMYIVKGKKYRFSCYAKCEGELPCIINVSLRGKDNGMLAQREFVVDSEWTKQECTFEAEETTDRGSLAILLIKGKNVELDFVSLFPSETFRGRENGLRMDIAQALEELKPKFVRFPGGCLVHDGSLDKDARDSLYRWENTIGPLKERPARRNNWKYNQTLGLGYYEYFLFCEDIGAKPVPILPAAYDPHHRRAVPIEELEPWIQEALDLIEFANGDETTKWGAVRAGLGHKEPFGLKYIGIGNEEVGEAFRERFPYFVRAIHSRYPKIQVIGSSGPFCGGGEYDLGWKCAQDAGADLVDEHYYMSPEWFIANMHRYDSFGREKPNVFLGEYAARSNTGKSALTEAAFMTQLQNACHAVKMACYAPLLCHRDYENWSPDLLWFDNEKICKTVNYEVQKLFMNHMGDELLSCELKTDIKKEIQIDLETRKRGSIYFWGNEAKVAFSHIVLHNNDSGEEIRFADREALADKIPVLLTEDVPQNFTLKFHAKELKGEKGFRVYFAWKDERNRMCWVLGGWENQDAAFFEDIDGKNSFLTQSDFQVIRKREYELELRVEGKRIEGWIDGELFQWTKLAPVELEPLYVTASREVATSDIILKAVNLRDEIYETDIELSKSEDGRYLCESYILLEEDCTESAEFPDIEVVNVKQEKKMQICENKGCLHYQFPPRSVTVLRIKKASD